MVKVVYELPKCNVTKATKNISPIKDTLNHVDFAHSYTFLLLSKSPCSRVLYLYGEQTTSNTRAVNCGYKKNYKIKEIAYFKNKIYAEDKRRGK